MLRAEDLFEDIRITESNRILELRSELSSLDAQITLAQRAQAIQNYPGWQDFVNSINEACSRVTNELISTTRSNEYMRQLQGKAQALRDVSTILVRSKSLIEELAKRRAIVQDHLATALKSAPRQQAAEQT